MQVQVPFTNKKFFGMNCGNMSLKLIHIYWEFVVINYLISMPIIRLVSELYGAQAGRIFETDSFFKVLFNI